jgi:hypothetical protein
MPEQHTILGGKVHVYKRPNSTLWQSSSYFAGKNRRTSTKEESLSKAKEIAEDWYLQLRGKLRAGEIRSEKTFREISERYLHAYDIITQGQRNKRMWTASTGDRAFTWSPSSGTWASQRSPQERSRNTEFRDTKKQLRNAASHQATAPSIRKSSRCARPSKQRCAMVGWTDCPISLNRTGHHPRSPLQLEDVVA